MTPLNKSIMLNLLATIFCLFSILSLVIPSRVFTVLALLVVYLVAVVIALVVKLDFIAVTILIVYMGAIAVFFLFIVMILGGRTAEAKLTPETLFNFGTVFIAFLLIAPLYHSKDCALLADTSLYPNYVLDYIPLPTNGLEDIGYIMYTRLFFIFISVGFTLLFSIIGVIGLNSTIRGRDRSMENSTDQLLRIRIGGGKNPLQKANEGKT
jgi:NADH-quinone oxidoreductase subunit J